MKLFFHETVDPFKLLLLTKLDSVIRDLTSTRLRVLTRRGALAIDWAFVAFAALTLEK